MATAFRSRSSAFSVLVFSTLGAAAVLGGGTDKWLFTDSALILISLPLLGWALTRIWNADLDALQLWGIAIASAMLLLQALQLIPLPPSVWTELPGRERIVEVFQAASIELPWYPISLSSAATLHGIIAMVPSFAIFLAVLTLTPREAESLVLVIGGLGAACALLGLIQVAMGPVSVLRYQLPEDVNSLPVGFFANRNHTALFLAIAALLLGWAVTYSHALRSSRWINPLAFSATGFVICLAVSFLTLSRSGFILSLCTIVFAAVLYYSSRTKFSRTTVTFSIISILLIIGFVVQFQLIAFVDRFEDKTGSTQTRLDVTERTIALARDYGPFGSGFGTFPIAYAMQERGADVRNTFMNQAHNDWAQLALEGGLGALALALVFIFWIGQSVLTRSNEWRNMNPARGRLTVAAAVAILFVLGHSLADYPLKTLAIQSVFAACCGLVCLRDMGARHPHGRF